MLLNFAGLLFPKAQQNTIVIPKTARAKARGQKQKVETNENWGARVQDYHVISRKPNKTSREHTLLRILIKIELCLLTSALPDYFQNSSTYN